MTTPAVEDFSIIRENIERLKKEKQEVQEANNKSEQGANPIPAQPESEFDAYCGVITNMGDAHLTATEILERQKYQGIWGSSPPTPQAAPTPQGQMDNGGMYDMALRNLDELTDHRYYKLLNSLRDVTNASNSI